MSNQLSKISPSSGKEPPTPPKNPGGQRQIPGKKPIKDTHNALLAANNPA